MAGLLEAAIQERERLWDLHDIGRPIRPGEPIPMISPDYIAADERIQVLSWQLEQIR